MEKVSVIIPTFNSAEYIQETVRSALAQSHRNIEVIVVDDASKDNTAQVVASIEDHRVVFIGKKVNEGAAKARNDGTERATGRYIAFLDADDRWRPDKLESQLGIMKKEGAAFSYTAYIAETEKGDYRIKVPPHVDYEALLRGNVVGTSTVVYDTAAIGKIFMPDLRMRQDYATWLNVLRRLEYGLGVQEPLTYYRRRSGSLSSSVGRGLRYTFRVYRDTQGIPIPKTLFFMAMHLVKAARKRVSWLW